jgi:hypothetical protein
MTIYLRLILSVLISLSLMTFVPLSYASNDDLDELQGKLGNEWVIIKNDRRRNIKTYAKQEDGKRYRSFKVEAILDSSVEAGARVLLDVKNYTKWYWEVIESRMLAQISPTEYYIYLVHRAPVTLPDRDVILHATVELQKKPSDPIIVRIKSVPDYIAEKPPLIRMPAEDMILYVTPLPNNKVKIYVEGYVDPGGRVPTWSNNYIQRIAPYSILLGLLRMMTSDTYRYAKDPLPFKVYNSPDDR